jgi:flagellar basal-body rod protein FlgG
MPEIIIPSGAQNFNVGFDGTVTVKMGGETQEIGQLGVTDFINPTGLMANGGNYFSPSRSSGDPIDGVANSNGIGRIAQRQLESSNVDIVEEMVNMITGQRAYEINSKVIQTGDQMLQTTTNIR